ncbi:membrane-anchored protein [Phyllobacterium sp. 628]|uniref:membrane-anchored protein n=1 Tax=Phyllobacterium sp. 628 TaxID=2718938 RepID=UPI001FCE429A|nr:membrane-anchored protein [Phyllobacterium sp. 628]
MKPRPPAHSQPFTGPVVVVGSAPVSTMPAGFDASFHVISVNGSQQVCETWGRAIPDVAIMQFNQVEGQTVNAQAVRKVLNGKATGYLYVMRWPKSMTRLKRGLAAFDYSYNNLKIINRFGRMSMFEALMGRLNVEIDDDMKFSNGMTAVFYALTNGAKAVILTGINPDSSGHIYNDANLKRLHVGTDKDILQTLNKRGFPLFTADPEVAKATGLPLWTR